MIVRVRLAVAVAASLVTAAQLASADVKHILVLRSEGSVDDATRTKIDAQVLKLAKNIRGNVEAADITLSDAAAAAGCVWSDAGCKDQVLSTMGVDELVATTASPITGSDVKISVRRVPRVGAAKEASATVVSGQAVEARLAADVGPLFGLAAPRPDKTVPPPDKTAPDKTVPPPDKAVPVTDKTGPGSDKAVPPSDKTGPASDKTGPASDKISTGTAVPVTPDTTSSTTLSPGTTTVLTPDTTTVPPPDKAGPPNTSTAHVGTDPELTVAPNNQIGPANEGGGGGRKWEVTGMAAGGAFVITGVALWAAAGGVQDDINNAPTRTLKDIQHLRDLENKGDTYTTVGNVMFAAGVVVGGVSGYFFWRHRHHGGSHQAMLVPTVLDHGAGVTLTFGGTP